MHFRIEEHYYKQSSWSKLMEVMIGFLMLFYLPIAYGRDFIKKIKGTVDTEPVQQDVWIELSEVEYLKVWSLALNDEEATRLLESEKLDFPNWKDWEDPFRFLLKVKTEPLLPDLEDMIFDEVSLVNNRGIYLIRINEKGKGMTLCFISATEGKVYEVRHLISLSWVIDQIDDTTIQLSGHSDKGKYVVKVETGHNN